MTHDDQEEQSISMPLPKDQSFSHRSGSSLKHSASRRSASSGNSARIGGASFRNFPSHFHESISYTSYSNINVGAVGCDESMASLGRPRVFVAPSGARYCIGENGQAVPPPANLSFHEPPIEEDVPSTMIPLSNDPPPPPPPFPPVRPMEPHVDTTAPSRRCLQNAMNTKVPLLVSSGKVDPPPAGAALYHPTLCSRCGTTCWACKDAIVFRCPACNGVNPNANLHTMELQTTRQPRQQQHHNRLGWI